MPIPKLLVTVGLMAVQVGLGMLRKIKGPRLESLKTTTAEYGTPINRFWGKRKFEVPVIWAEDLREKKVTSKGKGGKSTEYKYYATFAVLICDHEIDVVSRIWMDDKLVYDATGSGPMSYASLFSSSSGTRLNTRNTRIYLGTEDQEPDPRMEEWCEDRYGADSCPAYRGSAYVVFEDLPVNNFGNRIPNVTIEAISNKADAYPSDTSSETETASSANWTFSPDGTRFMNTDPADFSIWDIPTRTKLRDGSSVNWAGRAAIGNDGRVYVASIALNAFVYDADMTAATALTETVAVEPYHAINAGGTICYTAWDGDEYAIVASGLTLAKVSTDFHANHYFADLDGNAWAVGGKDSEARLYCVAGDRAGAAFSIASGDSSEAYGVVNSGGDAVIFQGGNAYRIDLADGSVLQTDAHSLSTYYSLTRFCAVQPGEPSIWLNVTEYSLETLTEIRAVNLTNWGTGLSGGTVFDPVNHALLSRNGSNFLVWHYLDRITNAGVTLATVVNSVSEWCGVEDYDTTALTQTVLGYSVTQGSGKDMIGPLLDVYDVDCRPHDFSVQFVNRGSAPVGSISTSDFVRDGDRYTVTITQDTDLPKEVTINFADSDHDQQTNTAIAQRPLDATDSKRTETIDLSTFVDTADGAQQKVDRFFRRSWNSRERIKNTITAQELAREPADLTTLYLDGTGRNARLDKMTIRGSAIDCEWVRDETSFATLNDATGAEIEGGDTDTISIPSPAKGFVLDLPLLNDSHNDVNPLLYFAAGSYSDDFNGATLYQSDGEDYTALGSIDSTQGSVWGYADEALGDANPNLWDRGNSVDVTVFGGTLTSTTEAAIDVNPSVNLAYLGGELINFATATLTGTSGNARTYTLSGLKRGRRGTEWACGDHASGDAFLLLTHVAIEEFGASDIGDDLAFTMAALGRDPSTSIPIEVEFAGNSLKPYAPARVKAEFDGTDWTFTVIRRTRVGGAWTSGTAIPLSENSEAYEIDILDGASVVDTLTLTGTNSVTWTEAEQIAAFGSAQTTKPDLNAYQMSDVIGRGFALAA